MATKSDTLDTVYYQNITDNEDEKREAEVFENMRSFVINPRNGVVLAPFLSYRLPVSTSSEKLEEIVEIICEKIFNPPTERSGYVVPAYAAFCKGFGDIKVTKEMKGFKQIISFDEILTDKILNKLEERFSYKDRLMEQLKIRPVPEENKRKWLENQVEKQKRNLRSTARISIQFIQELHQLNSEIVYKIMDFLLQNAEEEPLDYLCQLLKAVGRSLDLELAKKHRIQKPTAQHFFNEPSIKLNEVFRKMSLMSIGNQTIPTYVRTSMQELIKLRQNGWKKTETSSTTVDGGGSFANISANSFKSFKSIK